VDPSVTPAFIRGKIRRKRRNPLGFHPLVVQKMKRRAPTQPSSKVSIQRRARLPKIFSNIKWRMIPSLGQPTKYNQAHIIITGFSSPYQCRICDRGRERVET
jgi:hypothetical protein